MGDEWLEEDFEFRHALVNRAHGTALLDCLVELNDELCGGKNGALGLNEDGECLQAVVNIGSYCP